MTLTVRRPLTWATPSDVASGPVLLIAGLIAPMVIVSGLPRSLTGWVIFLTTSYSGVRFVWTLLGREPRPVRMFTWLFLYFVLGLAPLVQYARNVWPLYPPPSDEHAITVAAVLTALFVVAVDAGSSISAARASHRNRPISNTVVRFELAPIRLIALVPMSLAVAIYEFNRFGGSDVLFASRLDRAQQVQTSTSTSLAINSALLTIPTFICAYVLLVGRRTGQIQGWRLTTVAMIAVAVVLTNPFSSARFTLLTVYLGLFFAARWPISRRLLIRLSVLVIVGLFLIFPLLNIFRTMERTQQSTGSITKQLSSGDYDAFQQTINTNSYAQARGFQLGHEEVGAVLFFIPHAVWPGRAADTGVTVALFENYDYTNLSDPLSAEAYVDGGLPWVVIIGVGFGALTERMERIGREQIVGGPGYWQLFAPIFALYQLSVLRGSLLQSIGFIFAIAIMLRLCVRKRPGAQRPAQDGS